MPLMHVASANRMRSMKPDAQRAQVYLALIGGADGIIWWIWPPCRADNWATIKLLAAEMRKLSPVLTEPPAPTKVRWEPAALRDTVQVRAIQRNDITFLLAANAVETAATVQIKLPASAKPRAPGWFENRVMQITGGAFSDRFEGYDRHVYEIHGQWPTSEEITLQIKLDQPGREDPVHRAAPLEDELLLDPGCESDLYWSLRLDRCSATGRLQTARRRHADEREAVPLQRAHRRGKVRNVSWALGDPQAAHTLQFRWLGPIGVGRRGASRALPGVPEWRGAPCHRDDDQQLCPVAAVRHRLRHR